MVTTKIRVLISGLPFRYAKELQSKLPLHYEPVLCEGTEKIRELIPIYRSELVIHLSSRERVPLDTLDTDCPVPFILLDPQEMGKSPEELDALIMKKRLSPDNRDRDPFLCLRGNSQAMEEVRYKVQKAALTDLPVLLEGEPGAGKDTLAQIIHRLSPRKAFPLVSINCGAVSKKFTELEFFGAVKGTFPGADHKEGYCQKAEGGTLYLDTIDDFHRSQQGTLLSFLSSGRVQKVGNRSPELINARVIASTLGRSKRLRMDFISKLNTLKISIPPLRDRCEDIPTLARHFLDEMNLPSCVIEKRALVKLQQFDWPGNLRQLKNTLTRATIYFSNTLIKEEHIELY